MIRRKWSAGEIVLGGAFLLAVIALLTFYVWYQTEAVRLGVEIGKREEEIKALKNEILRLELRRTTLLAPDRVDKIARESLGLVDPKPGEIIYGNTAAAR
jgi:cell division protein FtsL